MSHSTGHATQAKALLHAQTPLTSALHGHLHLNPDEETFISNKEMVQKV